MSRQAKSWVRSIPTSPDSRPAGRHGRGRRPGSTGSAARESHISRSFDIQTRMSNSARHVVPQGGTRVVSSSADPGFRLRLILGYFMTPGRAGLGPCHCRGSREIVVFSVTFAQPSSSFAIPVQPSTHLRRRPQSANSIQGRPVGRRPLNPVRRGAGVPSPIRPGDGPSPARRGEGPKPRAKWGGMTGGVRSPARRGDME